VHQVHALHGQQRIGWAATFALRVMLLDQGSQPFSRYYLFHLD
jgi:hypothetical protein